MSSGVKSFLFLMLIPFFAGVGHDVWLNWFSDDRKIQQIKRLKFNFEDFKISDLGWIWNTYSPDTMAATREEIDPAMWIDRVDPLLQLPTMVVGAFPFFVGAIFLIIAFALGVWPFSRYGKMRRQTDDEFAIYKHAKAKSAKYSKK